MKSPICLQNVIFKNRQISAGTSMPLSWLSLEEEISRFEQEDVDGER